MIPMLPTITINRIADELLYQARTSPFGFTDPSGVPVSSMYRCDDLERLPPGLQQEIVHRATRAVSGSLSVISTVLTSLASLIVIMLLADVAFGKPLPYPLILSLVPLVPLLQVAMTRQAVRRIAAEVAASWPVAARR